MTPESYSESVRVKAEFRQELYKVTDSRIANLDAQAVILVAAAVAIAGFVAAAGRDGGLAGWKLALVGVIGGASALFALYARRDHPSWIGEADETMKSLAQAAADAVADIDRVPDEAQANEAYHQTYQAWRALVDSADARRKCKLRVYLVAVILLIVELLLAMWVLAG